MSIQCCMAIPPNWMDPIKVAHKWRTGIQRSVRGYEKRSGYFSQFRFRAGYRIDTMTHAQFLWLRRNLYKYQAALWGVPLWVDPLLTTGDIGMGDTVIPVETTTYTHFSDARYCILISDYETYEWIEIVSVAANAITVTPQVTGTWLTGSLIYPMFPALIGPKISLEDHTASLSGFELSVEEFLEYVP